MQGSVADGSSRSVTVIDGYNDSKTEDIPIGKRPVGIAIEPHRDKIYVTNSDSNTVSVINGSTNKVQDIPVGSQPSAIAIDEHSNMIYVANQNTVSVINGSTNKVQDIPVGNGPVVSLSFALHKKDIIHKPHSRKLRFTI